MTDNLIIALDLNSISEARAIVNTLGDEAGFYKVGMELYAATGPDFVRELVNQGKDVFLDLKFYDISETVKRATSVVARMGARFLTVHGNLSVMKAAIEGRGGAPLKLLGVSVLTSWDQEDLRDEGTEWDLSSMVMHRARNAQAVGVDGVVASPLEAAALRTAIGPDMLIVTPGVRSEGASRGDQKRVATPAEAVRDGASYLVIGRQVTRAQNPAAAIRQIRAEIGCHAAHG